MSTVAVPSPGSGDTDLLLAQIREAYGRTAYAHKTHEKQADMYADKHRSQRRWKVALTAVSSGAFLASLFGLVLDEQWAALATSFIAVVVSASNLGDKTFRYGEDMQQHRETATKLWAVRESYMSLMVDLLARSVTMEDARARRDQLQEQAGAVYKDAPRTTETAYGRAQDALKGGELTFSEAELDELLPPALRSRQEG